MTISPDIQLALMAAQEAASLVKKNFGGLHVTTQKDGKGIVTETDQAAEKSIIYLLSKKTEYSILAEESGYTQGSSSLQQVPT